ncbi:MAG: helix-turn-helix domain-containing protein [Candidatus Dormiibacterota bacterium]
MFDSVMGPRRELTITGSYREWSAHPDLREIVQCLWTKAVGDQPAPPYDRVLPDGCMDIIWDGMSVVVAGPDTGPVSLADRPGVVYAGVRFRTGRAHPILGVPAWELVDQRVPLRELGRRDSSERLIADLQVAPSPEAAARLLENDVLARLPNSVQLDPVVDALVASLSGAPGIAADTDSPKVADFCRRIGVIERQLLRRCRAAIGYGPKTLDRILRLQRVFSRSLPASTQADLAVDSGYADQSHLSRECRRLAGLTPSDLFKPGAIPQA